MLTITAMYRYRVSRFIFLFTLFLAFLCPPVHAAPGDFLYKWGVEDYTFFYANGVAVDSNGNMFVIDYSAKQVTAFDNKGRLLRTWGGFGKYAIPRGIAVDSKGDVYVTSGGNMSAYIRIKVFSRTGEFLREWGSMGKGDGKFYQPNGIAIDANDNVYVTDSGNDYVQVFDADGKFLRRWGEYGIDDGDFIVPRGIAVDQSGYVYVADSGNKRIQVFDSEGNFIKKWSGTGDNQLGYPEGVAVDSNGNVFVTDHTKYRVEVFNSDGTFLRKWGSQGNLAGQFAHPAGIAVNSSGNVYVTDYQNVQLFTNEGSYIRMWHHIMGDGILKQPQGVATDMNGNVYVVDTGKNRVQVFDSTGGFIHTCGSEYPGGTGDGQFRSPAQVTLDSNGNVYVTDRENKRVQVFDNTCTFKAKWTSYGADETAFSNPTGVAIDSNDNIFVSDGGKLVILDTGGNLLSAWGTGVSSFIALDARNNVYLSSADNTIKVYSDTGTFLRTVGSSGSGDGQFLRPSGLTVDYAGNLYVIDAGHYRAQVFDSMGNYLGKWGSQGAGDGQFNTPYGIAVSPDGKKVFITDSNPYNNNVQVFAGFQSCVVTAHAGPDQFVEQTSSDGATVELNGSATQEGCTGDMIYAWSWPGGSAAGANPAVLLSAGTTTVTLTVSIGLETASDTVTITVRDTIPPDTTPLISGTSGMENWYSSDVIFSLNASDSGSGVREIAYRIDQAAEIKKAGDEISFTLASEGAHIVFFNAKDNAGNQEDVDSRPVKIDKTPPTVTADKDPLPNGKGWNKTDVTVGFHCDDTLSGIATCAQRVTVTNEVSNQTVTGAGADKAGNPGSGSTTVSIDKTPPSIDPKISPDPNRNGWNNSDVTVSFECKDDRSDIDTCTSPVHLTTEVTGTVIPGHAKDNADNSADTSIMVNIDKTPPTITPSAVPAPNSFGWNNTDVTVTFTCTDNIGGSGIDTCPEPLTLTTDGRHVITVTAHDKAGNTGDETVTVNIDKTKPVITPSISPSPNANGWSNTDVTVTFTCTDNTGGSGIDTCPEPLTLTTDGRHVITITAHDKAGNTGDETVTVNIDKTKPVITPSISPSPNANGWNNTDVTVTFTCTDNTGGSGIDTCPEPQTFNTDAEHTITVTATDKAGNSKDATVTVKIDKAKPEIDLFPSTNILWPPNHKMVNVKINGGVIDTDSGIESIVFTVTDEYGLVQPSISGFNSFIALEAWREGTDKDGRVYTITAVVTDRAGNQSTETATVIVPHDQRK